MSDKFATNFALNSANNAFSAIWKMSRVMKAAGWIYKASSDGTAKDTTGTATNDKWGGASDPLTDTYNAAWDTALAWWCAQGPTILKLSMTAVPGNFLRGEKVTQATSGAEGEIIGYDHDGVTNGHAVILPRTGTFDNSHVVTGASSGATFTPTALETYVSEVVISKGSTALIGSIYVQRVSNENENASRFSVLAGSAGCTATVAPGGGGTGNAFPTAGSYVARGTQTGTPTHTNWFTITTNMGRAQCVATNCTGAAGVSPDGTWWVLLGDVTSATQAQLLGYFRLDDTEDGDLDPFVFFAPTTIAANNANARVDGSGGGALAISTLLPNNAASTNMSWKGWRRRGWSSGDAFLAYGTATLWSGSTGTPQISGNDNLTNPETVACSYSTKRVRESIRLVSSQGLTVKQRKGAPRWMWLMQGNTTFDTFDNKTKIVAVPSSASAALLLGPYDGATTPLQA